MDQEIEPLQQNNEDKGNTKPPLNIVIVYYL